MAVLGAPTVTGYSPFWSNVLSPGNGGGTGGYTMSTEQSRHKATKAIAKLTNRGGMRAIKAIALDLIGVAPGETSIKTHPQVAGATNTSSHLPADVVTLGGVRTIETVTDVNRATTAADVDEIRKFFTDSLLARSITQPTVLGTDVSTAKQVGGTGRF